MRHNSQLCVTLPGMSRTPAQRGPFGNWLKESREARYRTQADALQEMRRLSGLTIAPSEYAQWESGSRVPRPDNPKVVGLIAFFGGDPFAADTERSGGRDTLPDLSELVALQRQLVDAFEVQAQAVMALVDELRLSRSEALEDIAARLRAVEAIQRTLHPELDTPASEGQSAPLATGGSGRAEAGA